MKFLPKFFACLIILAFIPLSAVIGSDEPPIRKYVLDNGLSVVLKPFADNGLSAIYLKVRSGAITEQEYAGTGITHFIEHMIFKGDPSVGIGRLAESIRALGGHINATTSFDATTFFITVQSRYTDEALTALSDAVMRPGFPPDEVEKERSVIINEIRLHDDDPSRKITDVLFETCYQVHPYRFPLIGYESLLKGLRTEDLVSYHGRYYVPNNMVLSIAGDIDPEKTSAAIKKIFLKYDRKRYPVIVNPAEPEQISPRKEVRARSLNLGYFALGYHSVSVLDSDLFALDTLSSVLGGGEGSRLYTSLVKDKELLYSIDASDFTPVDPGLFIISGVGDPEKLDRAVAVIRQEIEKVIKEGVRPEECQKAKQGARTGYLKTLETVDGTASSAAEGMMFAGDANFDKHYLEGLEKVTPADVGRAAKKYLLDTNSSLVYLVPEKVKKTEEVVSAQDVAQKTASFEVLGNGIRVIVKEDHRVPLVTIVVGCQGGLRAEPQGKNGISGLTVTMLVKGTTARKEQDIVPAMEDKGASLSTFSGMNNFGLSAECQKQDLLFTLDILEDVIKDPVFPEGELKKEKDKIVASIKSEYDDVFDHGLYLLKKGIFKEHPYGNRTSGEIQAVTDLNVGDVRAFYKEVLNPEHMVISVVGDVDAGAVLAEIKKRFSSIPKNGFVLKTPAEIPLKKSFEEKAVMPREEAVFMTGFNGPDFKDPDRYPLEVFFSVMSGAEGRLFKSIRDTFGLSYVQGGGVVPGVDPGFCYFFVASSGENIDAAKKVLIDQIRQFKANPPSDDELAAAKNTLISRSKMSLQSASGQAVTMAMDELSGSGYNSYLEYEKNIMDCTRADVLRVAAKYLLLDRSYSVKILPGSGGEGAGS